MQPASAALLSVMTSTFPPPHDQCQVSEHISVWRGPTAEAVGYMTP